MGKRHEVSDEEWAVLDSVIPNSKAKTGRPTGDRREMLNGALCILCTGAQWRDLDRGVVEIEVRSLPGWIRSRHSGILAHGEKPGAAAEAFIRFLRPTA